MIKTTFGDDSLSERRVIWRHNVFLEGRERISDELRVRQPLTTTVDENVARFRELLNTDRRLSKQFTDKKSMLEIVPKVLADDQRSRRLLTTTTMRQRTPPFP